MTVKFDQKLTKVDGKAKKTVFEFKLDELKGQNFLNCLQHPGILFSLLHNFASTFDLLFGVFWGILFEQNVEMEAQGKMLNHENV